MKKIFTTIISIVFIMIIILTGKTYAANLNSIDIKTDKTTIRPGEEVAVNISFGTTLGAYTFDISYDDAIFEYVSTTGGSATDTKDKVIVVYYDTTGGNEPKSEMSITFKAKSELTTSNPTQFLVTAEGLANNDASITYDDITTPIVRDVIVEPEYVDYTLNLEAEGSIIKGEEKDMKISYSSTMGRYYEHARLVAEAKTPEGATVELLGKDQNGTEYEIIESGWGDSQGYGIGGKNYSMVLNIKGLFSAIGDYTITLKLVDNDASSSADSIIAQKSFEFKVGEKAITSEPIPENTTGNLEESKELEKESTTENTIENKVENTTETPKVLPKTGINIYIPIGILLISGLGLFVYFNKRKS